VIGKKQITMHYYWS